MPSCFEGSSNTCPRGYLVICHEGDLANKVYLIDEEGRRHWMLSERHINSYGFQWPTEVRVVDEHTIRQFKIAGPAPLTWSHADRIAPPRTSASLLREIATSRLTGSGIEFGAGTMPVAVPLSCKVSFADFLPETELRARAYSAQGNDFVELSYITGMEQMNGIADGSLDFIIAAHVIEHTRNPLRAVENAYRKLKKGGNLVLFVPDMRLTFDKLREITPLEHLIADYENPSSERDVLHYVEFFSRAFITPIESLYQRVRDAIATNHDLHFHTWTYESFQNMVSYCRQSMSPWSDVWSHPAAELDKDANEFYFVLTK